MLCITAISGIHIPEPLGRGFEIYDGCFITNDTTIIKKKVPPRARPGMGHEYHHFFNLGLVAYYEADHDSKLDKPRADVNVLTNWLFYLRAFYQALWLVKDNAATNELGFGIYLHPVTKDTTCCSNVILSSVTTSKGTSTPTDFSVDELRRARHFYQEFTWPLAAHDQLKDLEAPGSVPRLAQHLGSPKGRSRLCRFNYFLSGARSLSDVDGKISMYMTCLEILFSTTTSELTHKLSERVAFFLESDPNQRKQLFNTIKAAYAIRSKIVHGDEVEPSEKIFSIAEQIDTVLRRVFLKIIENPRLQELFEKDKSSIEEFFVNLTLGIEPAQVHQATPPIVP